MENITNAENILLILNQLSKESQQYLLNMATMAKVAEDAVKAANQTNPLAAIPTRAPAARSVLKFL